MRGIETFKRLRIAAFALGLLALSSTTVFAQATFYVRAGASGSGLDWNNAYGSLPATLVRGATYYVGAGSYGGYTFDDPVSGTTVITVKKATASDHGTNSGWQAAYANQAVFNGTVTFTTSYYTLNGQVRNSDWRSGYGFKVDVSNLGGSYGIVMGIPFTTRVTNIKVDYVEVHGTGSDPNIGSPDPINDRGIIAACSATCVGSDQIYVGHSYVHDQGNVTMHMFRTSNLTIEYTWMERDNSTALEHGGGINCPEGCVNVVIRHNVLSDIEGTAYIETPTGGHPGCGSGAQASRDWYIYGNTFMRPTSPRRDTTGNGVIYLFDTNHTGAFDVHNNTIIGMPNAFIGFEPSPIGGGCATNMNARNNLFYNNSAGGISTANVANAVVSHNAFFNSPSSGANAQVGSGNPFVNVSAYDFRLTAPTAAGFSLAAPYNADLSGCARGGDGVWDRGAVEYSSTGGCGTTPPPLPPSPPTSLRIVQ